MRVTNFKEMNSLVYIAPIFEPRYKLVCLEHSLCDLFREVQHIVIALKVKAKVEALFDEY